MCEVRMMQILMFLGRTSPGVSWRCVAERHTLMVVCTTPGNPRDRFSKRPRQTSRCDHYGPWHGDDSAPGKGLTSGLADAQKENESVLFHRSFSVLGNPRARAGWCRASGGVSGTVRARCGYWGCSVLPSSRANQGEW